jgi:atlastin
MPNKETDKNLEVRSVQIIRIEGSKFIFNYDIFQNIIEADMNMCCRDLPVAVVIINGALRTGKSFFSNFIIRHLMRLNKNEKDDSNDMLKDYFTSRRGSDVQTLGVWALNKIFIYNGMAVVLMDTQGIFDQELNQAMTIALISLSTIVSSYQIYNLDKRIQEDHLCNMAYFSAYSSLISNTNNTKIGQTLCLLVRDWQHYENNFDIDKCVFESEIYKEDFLCAVNTKSETKFNLTDPVKLETRKKIFNTYDNVVVRLCPHPGYIITEGKFSGKLSEIRDDFKIHVDHIIKEMLNNVQPKRITGQQILLCKELPKYMKEYVLLYENVKESLPEAMTILETTEKICQETAKTKTILYYKEKMSQRIKNKIMTKDDIDAWHKFCLRESLKHFNRMYIMGKDEDIQSVKQSIMATIDDEYKNFLLFAKKRNILSTIIENFTTMVGKMVTNIDLMNQQSVGMMLFISVLIYMLTFYINGYLPAIANLIAYFIRHILCVFAGIYICLYVKNQNNAIREIPMTTNNLIPA